MKVMLVDDEKGIRMLVGSVVEREGHEFCCTKDATKAVELFQKESPEVVVLDVMMPRVDGYEICRRIRELDADVPILFLSARGNVIDKRMGFNAGGDDYLVKPFEEEELVMRLEALVRRSRRRVSAEEPRAAADEPVELGPFFFDTSLQRVLMDGEEVPLTPKEYQLLFHLAKNAGVAMGKEELIEELWGKEYVDGAISVAVYVRRIRSKIEKDPAKPTYLKTRWGVGYVFEA